MMWHYLHDPTFSRFDTIPACDRQTHRKADTRRRHTALSIASRGKNLISNRIDLHTLAWPTCHRLYAQFALDNPVTVTFDLVASGSVYA